VSGWLGLTGGKPQGRGLGIWGVAYGSPASHPDPPNSWVVEFSEESRFERQFRVAEDGPAVTINLLNLLKTIAIGGKQVHDANIVSTMEAHGLRHLLTHNVADFHRFASRIVVIPLVSTP
jgi:hypothetical protein